MAFHPMQEMYHHPSFYQTSGVLTDLGFPKWDYPDEKSVRARVANGLMGTAIGSMGAFSTWEALNAARYGAGATYKAVYPSP